MNRLIHYPITALLRGSHGSWRALKAESSRPERGPPARSRAPRLLVLKHSKATNLTQIMEKSKTKTWKGGSCGDKSASWWHPWGHPGCRHGTTDSHPMWSGLPTLKTNKQQTIRNDTDLCAPRPPCSDCIAIIRDLVLVENFKCETRLRQFIVEPASSWAVLRSSRWIQSLDSTDGHCPVVVANISDIHSSTYLSSPYQIFSISNIHPSTDLPSPANFAST